jgi:endonuclease/exonuclease/phosphatase family metal-dependent hydrolase
LFKVLTLNLNYYVDKHGAWPHRLDLITAAIQDEQPDLLAFQAVRQDPELWGGDHQAAQIASRFNDYPYIHFQPAITNTDRSAEGSAILSKVPFAELNSRQLTLRAGTDDPTQRVVLHARFDLPEGPFHLFNGHFSWVEEQAQDNVKETLSFLDLFSGQRMLVGDLNAAPDSIVIKRFEAAGWTDAWGALFSEQNGYTFESNQPSMRIDYAWLDQALVGRLRSIHITADTEDNRGARPSDHLGLLVDLDLTME